MTEENGSVNDITPTIEKSIFSERLFQLRKKYNFSQRAVGLEAGYSDDSASPRINVYERSKHQPVFNTVKRIAAVFEIDPSFFYTENEKIAEFVLSRRYIDDILVKK